MICLQVIGFAGLTLITLNLVMFSYRAVILDNPRSLARVGFIPVKGEREREGRRTKKNEGLKWHSHSFTVCIQICKMHMQNMHEYCMPTKQCTNY